MHKSSYKVTKSWSQSIYFMNKLNILIIWKAEVASSMQKWLKG